MKNKTFPLCVFASLRLCAASLRRSRSVRVFALVTAPAFGGCGAAPTVPGGVEDWPSFQVRVKNPTDRAFSELPVVLKLGALRKAHPGFNPDGYRVFVGKYAEIPSQCDDLDLDGTPDEMALELNLGPRQEKTLTVYTHPHVFQRAVYPRRAHATVRPEFEGPGWESDLIAYRSYVDERAPVDIFGKLDPWISLDLFAGGGHGGYHAVNPWGVDVLKVGDALGCGGFALWHEGKLLRAINPPVHGQRPYKWEVRRYAHVVVDGPVRAIVRFSHDQWKVGEETVMGVVDYEIWGGKRWSKCAFRLKHAASPKTAATGIVSKPGVDVVKRDTFFYTYGAQSEIVDETTQKPDLLGMAVFFRKADFVAWEDAALSHSTPEKEPVSHVVTLSMGADHAVTWWFLAAWSRGSLGIASAEAFEKHLQEVAAEIAAQPEVTYP